MSTSGILPKNQWRRHNNYKLQGSARTAKMQEEARNGKIVSHFLERTKTCNSIIRTGHNCEQHSYKISI